MSLSFQERLRLARINAKSKPEKQPAEKAVKKIRTKKGAIKKDDIAKKAKGILKARREKVLDTNSQRAHKADYTINGHAGTREKPLPNRPLELDQLIKVRIDSRTEVYVKPGYDLEALKRKYAIKPLNKGTDDMV